jgi:hypothetical protein
MTLSLFHNTWTKPMMTPFKSALATAALLAFGALPLQAETAPLVVTAKDVAQRLTELSAKSVQSPEDLRELAVLTFIKAANAPELSKKELKSYVAALSDLAEASNEDPETAAVRAVFYGIQAREASSDMKALILAKKGIDVLDDLVEENPENGGVLMQRGLAALYAPSFLGRDSVFIEDFNSLLSDRFALPPLERAYVLYNLLQGYKKVGDADSGSAVQAELASLKVAPWTDLGADISF